MNSYTLSLLALGFSASSWLCVRLSYTYLPASWDDKPFWVGFLLYLAGLVTAGFAVSRASSYAGLATTSWWQGALAVLVALAVGLLALCTFVVLYGEGMQGYKDR